MTFDMSLLKTPKNKKKYNNEMRIGRGVENGWRIISLGETIQMEFGTIEEFPFFFLRERVENLREN